MCRLKKLKWLDLKANPLNPDLARAAGDCADAPGCGAAAKNVRTYLLELQQQEEKAAIRKAKEEGKVKL